MLKPYTEDYFDYISSIIINLFKKGKDIADEVIHSYLTELTNGFLRKSQEISEVLNLINIFGYIIENNNINQFLRACDAGYFKILERLEKPVSPGQKRKVFISFFFFKLNYL
jgi:hypothetical protein